MPPPPRLPPAATSRSPRPTVVKVMCDAAVANGALLEADSAGKAVTQSCGEYPRESSGGGRRSGQHHPGTADPSATCRR
jgi:hypothetical protein